MIDDRKLKEVLNIKLALLREYKPTVTRQKLSNWMADNYNVAHGETIDILKGNKPLESLPYHMLYKVMRSIKDSMRDYAVEINLSGLDEKMYFTDNEIREYNKKIKYEKFDKDIVISKENWTQENPNKIYISILASEFVKWRDNGKAGYNPDTQRDLVEVDKGDIKYLKLDINKESIKSMYDLLLDGKYDGDPIVLNANTDINTSVDMIPRITGESFVIPKKCILDLLDGWHRGEAIYMAKTGNAGWDYKFGIYIVTKNTTQANDFVFLQDKKNHLKDRQTERIDMTDIVNVETNYIIDTLRADSNFHLNKTIDTNIHTELNVIIKDIFSPSKRGVSYPIYILIKEKINELVQTNMYFDKVFSKEEWLIYLYIIKVSEDNFIDIVNNINIDELKENVKYTTKPLPSGYKHIENMISEVMK